jgi:hypothetical protein
VSSFASAWNVSRQFISHSSASESESVKRVSKSHIDHSKLIEISKGLFANSFSQHCIPFIQSLTSGNAEFTSYQHSLLISASSCESIGLSSYPILL